MIIAFSVNQRVRALFTIRDETSDEIFPEGRIGTVMSIQERPLPLVFVKSDFSREPVGCYPEELEAVESEAPLA